MGFKGFRVCVGTAKVNSNTFDFPDIDIAGIQFNFQDVSKDSLSVRFPAFIAAKFSSRLGGQLAAMFARSHSQFFRYAATSSIVCCHVSLAFREPIMFFSASMRTSLCTYPTKFSASTRSNLTVGQPTSSTSITIYTGFSTHLSDVFWTTCYA